ncbi:cation transporting ATPase [Suillus plorans]|uniref:Cation transporting ATPase n=1 Tax=Suillus plorans TaxID=116603 RepID=A0A9P7J3I1_9AGAM|nr:cation transporting ATPase [Suillus plorans]KAG1801010.1 cation transporting ATPase [Suillus plorans]
MGTRLHRRGCSPTKTSSKTSPPPERQDKSLLAETLLELFNPHSISTTSTLRVLKIRNNVTPTLRQEFDLPVVSVGDLDPTFRSNGLGKEVTIMLAWSPNPDGLYEDFFPIVWNSGGNFSDVGDGSRVMAKFTGFGIVNLFSNSSRGLCIQSLCSIYMAGSIIMEGPVLPQLDELQMPEIVSRLQVLARSSPEDKKILTEKLCALREIVAVTGDGNHVGSLHERRSLEIPTVPDLHNITAVVITSVTAIASSSETLALSAVQMLWINIIMDTFTALALATDPASLVLLNWTSDKQMAPLFTVNMYKQILLQSVYQITVILLFHFHGTQILGFTETSGNDIIVQTLVFNAFVFAQIFNSVNLVALGFVSTYPSLSA